MRITAKVDYAVRAAIELARAEGPASSASRSRRTSPTKGADLAAAQDIPLKFLEAILTDLKRAGLVASRRGSDGGYWLARPPDEITVADLIRAVEGPLADVRGARAEALDYPANLAALQRMWVAVRANLRQVLEHTSIADLRDGKLARRVDALADAADAWRAR